MPLLRVVSVTVLAVASLAVPTAAVAAPSISIDSTGQLGPEGATAIVFVTVSCDPGTTGPSISVSLAQSTGKILVEGSGTVGGMFGGGPIVCDGTSQSIAVTVRPNVVSGGTLRPFKQGGAAATATLSGFGPTGFFSITAGPQEIRLKK
jgi:hypothetical protein